MKVLLLLVGAFVLQEASAFAPGLYCELESCYDVLGIGREATKSEMAKEYRKLAKKWHPDRARGDEAKKEAEIKFRLIATAYETLKDDESRADYDYMLDHPEERYYHYYQYYRRRMAPKVDIRIVIVVTVLVISIIQHISASHKFKEAIDYLSREAKYRNQAEEMAKERGLLSDGGAKGKGKKRRDKETEKEEREAIIRSIIEENIDIKGGYKRPSLWDTLLCQLVLLPVTLFVYMRWWLDWTWRYTIQRHEYDDQAKLHLIRKNMKMSQSQFSSLPDEKHAEFLREELWIRDHFIEWKRAKEEEEKEKLAQSGRFKKYRRYMKNQGPGQISFLDE
uniref:J domain-containing protein n=1 Tax=Plectus sambesii TaxID=2011161 RepID=A0A914UXA6_9BILA